MLKRKTMGLLAIMLFLVCGTARSSNTPDISTFMQIGSASLAGVDWETGQMYFTSGMSGKTQVYRYMGDDEWPWQLSVFDDGIDDFYLSHNGQWGIILASVGGSEQSQLYLMNMSNGLVDTLSRFEDVQIGSVVWAQDDKSIFFRSNHETKDNFQVYRMNLENQEIIPVYDTPVKEGETPRYDLPAGMSRDSKYLFMYSLTSNSNIEIVVKEMATGKVTAITSDTADYQNFEPHLMPDGKTVYLLSNNNPDGILRLAKVTLGNPKLEFVTGWVDPKWTVDGLNFSRDDKYMAVTVNENGYSRVRIREVATGKELKQPPLDGMVSSPVFAKSGDVYFNFDGPTYAPDVWKYNPTTGKAEKLTKSMYAGIDRTTFSDPSLVSFKSFDGLEISAFLYLPPNYQKGQAIPFLVDAHGGPESQSRPDFARNYQYFALNGYGILRVNPRGSSGYGKEFLDLDNYKNRKNSLKDYKAAVDWLLAEGYTEKGKIGIYGGSYGGYVVLGMITEYPDLFDAAIDIVGIANFVSFLELTAPYRRGVREAEYGPLSDRPFLESISPLNKADQIRTPLFVIHGENDPRVPVNEARQILAAVSENGIPVDSLIFPDEGHGASKRVNVVRQYREMAKFFDTYLKGMKTESAEEK